MKNKSSALDLGQIHQNQIILDSIKSITFGTIIGKMKIQFFQKRNKFNKIEMKKILLFSFLFAFVAFGAIAQSNNTTKSTKKTIHLTKADFLAKVVNYEKDPTKWEYLGDKPCIIDFYASWCGPCKMLAPILEELAEEYDGQIYIYKINTEKEQELAAAFGIRSIPTLLFCPMGEAPQMAQGALPKATFKKAIEEFLLKNKPAAPKEI